MPPGIVLGEVRMGQIVEPAASQFALREDETGGVDDVDMYPQTGPEPQQGAGILRDIGLKGEVHTHRQLLTPPAATWRWV